MGVGGHFTDELFKLVEVVFTNRYEAVATDWILPVALKDFT